MPARDPALRRQIARAGGAARHHRPDAEDLRGELATTRLEQHIVRVVNAAPPLTAAQKDRLAALLLRPEATRTGQQVAS